LRGEEVKLRIILVLATTWNLMVSGKPRPPFKAGERTPVTHYTGGWVVPGTDLDTEPTGKIIASGGHRIPVVHSVVRHCTDRATKASLIFSNRFFCSKQGFWRLRILRGIQSLVAMSPNVRLLEALYL
jgi:hypothetical protein